MVLPPLLRKLSLLLLVSYSFVYTQEFETFETTTPSEEKVKLTIDSTDIDTGPVVEEYSSDELKNKISLYTKLQGAGIGICLAGAGSAIYGFSSATREAEEEKMISGESLFFISEGIVFFVGGIVMGVIMSNKVKEYKSRLGKISFNIDRRKQFTGLKVGCNF